jgi:uncharacterized protein (DUF1015 family)
VDDDGDVDRRLGALVARSADVDLIDADGVRHRLWAVPGDGTDGEAVAGLLAAAGQAPVTIADGHHRYETALRYRDERRMSRSCEEDPAFDYLLTLFLPTGPAPLTVLPTHRLVRDLDDATVAGLADALDPTFVVEPVATPDVLCERFEAAALEPGGAGRFGLWTREGGALLTARREAFASALVGMGAAVRDLDVVLLGATLERVLGIGPEAIAAGAVAYTKSARDAIDQVQAGTGGASAAFLLEPTPVASIMAVAAAGEVMPQKSTYFYPKALTGLVINPHEW